MIEVPNEIINNNDLYSTIHSLKSVIQKGKPNPFYPILLKTNHNSKTSTYMLDRKFWVNVEDSLIKNIENLSPNVIKAEVVKIQ